MASEAKNGEKSDLVILHWTNRGGDPPRRDEATARLFKQLLQLDRPADFHHDKCPSHYTPTPGHAKSIDNLVFLVKLCLCGRTGSAKTFALPYDFVMKFFQEDETYLTVTFESLGIKTFQTNTNGHHEIVWQQ